MTTTTSEPGFAVEQRALELFFSGCNCAQATAAAFAQLFDLEEDFVKKALAGFGGGFGGQRETCGAVSAMTLVLGLSAGDYPVEDTAAKKAFYDRIKAMHEEFREAYGTTVCRELLLKASCLPKPDPSERTAEYYAKRPCAHFVAAAAWIAAKHSGLCPPSENITSQHSH